MNKIIKFIALIISLLPTSHLRVLFYRLVFGYKIKKSKIGWRTVIHVKKAYLKNCVIGKGNHFSGPMDLLLENRSSIGNNNTFICGYWANNITNHLDYNKSLILKEDSRISSNHNIDVVGLVIIGKNSLVAGIGSQFWTHGAGVMKKDIIIGSNCYIGSGVKIKPGVIIGNNIIISLGSVITRDFKGENLLIGGNPAKIIKENYYWKKA